MSTTVESSLALLPRALLALGVGCSISGIGGFAALVAGAGPPPVPLLLLPPAAALALLLLRERRRRGAVSPTAGQRAPGEEVPR